MHFYETFRKTKTQLQLIYTRNSRRTSLQLTVVPCFQQIMILILKVHVDLEPIVLNAYKELYARKIHERRRSHTLPHRPQQLKKTRPLALRQARIDDCTFWRFWSGGKRPIYINDNCFALRYIGERGWMGVNLC